jgi:hypothetical protein
MPEGFTLSKPVPRAVSANVRSAPYAANASAVHAPRPGTFYALFFNAALRKT